MENQPPLVLASTSVYRRDLLARLGVAFAIARPDVAKRYANALVIGADQVADLDGVAVSKPLSHADAVEQLKRASGRSVVFHTAVALVNAQDGRCDERQVDVTTRFRMLTPAAIEQYLRREQPYDCAVAVKAEALGIALCESIRSDDPTALIGLPLIAVVDLLRAAGLDVLDSQSR